MNLGRGAVSAAPAVGTFEVRELPQGYLSGTFPVSADWAPALVVLGSGWFETGCGEWLGVAGSVFLDSLSELSLGSCGRRSLPK